MGQNVTAEGCAGLTHGGQGHAAAQERDRNAAPAGVELAIANPRLTAHIYHDGQTHYASVGPLPADGAYAPTLHYVGSLPPIFPEWLGDPGFRNAHHLRFAYVGGEMARGIASAQMVIAFGRAGMLGFLGAAGLGPAVVADAVRTIRADLDPAGLPWGVNLIHSPDEPELESHLVDVFLAEGVSCVSASAFMKLSSDVVRFSASGLQRLPDGRIGRATSVFAKVSRPEVAEQFMGPAPHPMLRNLVSAGSITPAQADMAALVPVAGDITAEADSGGHTDNRPLPALLPTLIDLREELSTRFGFTVRIGAAGGLGTPGAIAGAFAMGADYVLTGSVNQSAIEAGLAPAAKRMLADLQLADTMMAPSADMFELGVKVQVVRRGTLFGPRAQRLYEIYRAYGGIDDIPVAVREGLERDLFRMSIAEVWRQTEAFFHARKPAEVARAARDPKHRMALIFRWYLGKSSQWPIIGEEDRRLDYQLWCGPAMASFNTWVAGSFLEPIESRTVAQIGLNLMEGATVITRAQQLRALGVKVPSSAFQFTPRPIS